MAKGVWPPTHLYNEMQKLMLPPPPSLRTRQIVDLALRPFASAMSGSDLKQPGASVRGLTSVLGIGKACFHSTSELHVFVTDVTVQNFFQHFQIAAQV
jgi:hypothetical protein